MGKKNPVLLQIARPALACASGANSVSKKAGTPKYLSKMSHHRDIQAYGFHYNFLNLPRRIEKTGEGNIKVRYTASGQKLMQQTEVFQLSPTSQNETIYYDGEISYENGIRIVYTSEGRVTTQADGDLQYEYTLRDHLGNTRVTFADINTDGEIDQQREILQEAHYYPFGLQHYGPYKPTRGDDNNYTYNGKETIHSLGLNWLDYGARWYDAAVARWWAVDPLAKEAIDNSSYSYVFNDPISFNDPTGMMAESPIQLYQRRREKQEKRRDSSVSGKTDDSKKSTTTTMNEGGMTTNDPLVISNFFKTLTGDDSGSPISVAASASEEFKKQYEKDKKAVQSDVYGAAMYAYLSASKVKVEISEAWSLLGYIDDYYDVTASLTKIVVSARGDYISLAYSQINNVEVDGVLSNSIVVLAHELQHSVDYAQTISGLTFAGWPLPKGKSTTSDKDHFYYEARAVQTENLFRRRLGTPIRKTYSGKTLPVIPQRPN